MRRNVLCLNFCDITIDGDIGEIDLVELLQFGLYLRGKDAFMPQTGQGEVEASKTGKQIYKSHIVIFLCETAHKPMKVRSPLNISISYPNLYPVNCNTVASIT